MTLAVERTPNAADCPDAPALNARIAALRGHDDTHGSSVYVVGFKRTGTELTAAIRVGNTSVRVLRNRGGSCAALSNAVAVTLAMLIDADETQRPAVNQDSEPAPLANPPESLLEPKPRKRRARARGDAPLEGRLGLGASALAGALAPVAPALLASIGVQRGGARLELGVLWGLPRSLSLAPGSVSESLIAGTLRGCVTLLGERELGLDLCAGVFAGATRGEACGFTQNFVQQSPWLAVPVELSLARLAGPVGWELGASALAIAAERDYGVDGVSGVAYRTPPVAALFSIRGNLVFSP